jgi:hypothetical protein
VTARRDGKVIVVGHGPSIYTGRGSVIDTMTVVRLREGLYKECDPIHWGSRTDYLCARSAEFDHGRFPFWLIQSPPTQKLSTGTAAVLTAQYRLTPREIWVIGFDRVMHPEVPDPPYTWLAHNKWVERDLMTLLGVKELG